MTLDFHTQYERPHSSFLRNGAALVMFPNPEKSYRIRIKCKKIKIKIEDLFSQQQSKVKEGEMSKVCMEVCVDPENLLWEAGNSFTGKRQRTTLDKDFE